MLRLLSVLGFAGLVLAGCASTPTDMNADDMISSIAPPSAPPSMPAPAPVMTDEDTFSGGGNGAGSRARIVAPNAGGSGGAARAGFVYPAIGASFAGTRPETPYVMTAQGEGPYWRASAQLYEIEGDVFVDYRMVVAEHDPILIRLRPAPDHLTNGYRRFVTASPDELPISAAFQAGPCLDVDRIERSFFASVRIGNEVYDGCAREDGGQWDWSRDILARYAQILMCLDEVPGAVGAIDAYSPSEENTAVRVMTADQSRFECLIVDAEQRLASVRELDIIEVHLNEGRTVFLRDVPDENPCRSIEHILDRNGELMGVLAHDLCQNPRTQVERPLGAGES